MPSTLSHYHRANKPSKIALLAPYVDSVELSSTRHFHPALLRAVSANCGKMMIKPQRDHNDPRIIWRYRLIINQPSRYCIELIQLYARIDRNLSLYRFHLALDVIELYAGWTYEEVVDVVECLFHMRYRRGSDLILEYEGTIYSVFAKRRKSRPYRNTCSYNGRHSKITGEENAIHFEIRLERKRSVQTAGIHEPIDIFSLDLLEFFAKNIVVKDHRPKFARITEKQIKLTQEAYPDLDPAFVVKRVHQINDRIGLWHASVFAGMYPKLFERLPVWDCVDIEEDLNWACQDVQCEDDVGELHSLLPPPRIESSKARERLHP